MPLFSETQETIFGDIMSEVLESTNVTRSSAGAKMRALVEVCSRKLGRMWNQFDINMGQAFLEGAEGRWLSYIGDMMGIEKLGEEPATVSALDRNLKYYVDVGTFGDINGGSSIHIPSGTLIGTAEAGTGIQYRTVIGTILPLGNNEGYISVQSVRSGSDVNVGVRQLKYHNFSDYMGYVDGSLKVTNETEVVRGKDPESDLNYKFRISQQITAIEKANEVAIRLAALEVPGVADLTMIPYHRGIGTYDLLIKATLPTVSTGLITSVQQAIGKVTSNGLIATARGPVEVGISMVGTIFFKRMIAAEEESSVLGAVQSNIIDYLNNLDIAEDFIVNEAVERVMGTSEVIKTIGLPSKPFDNIFMYHPSRLEDNKVRSEVVADLEPKVDERLIVENRYAGATPILFRTAV